MTDMSINPELLIDRVLEIMPFAPFLNAAIHESAFSINGARLGPNVRRALAQDRASELHRLFSIAVAWAYDELTNADNGLLPRLSEHLLPEAPPIALSVSDDSEWEDFLADNLKVQHETAVPLLIREVSTILIRHIELHGQIELVSGLAIRKDEQGLYIA